MGDRFREGWVTARQAREWDEDARAAVTAENRRAALADDRRDRLWFLVEHDREHPVDIRLERDGFREDRY